MIIPIHDMKGHEVTNPGLVFDNFAQTNWKLLSEQKAAVIRILMSCRSGEFHLDEIGDDDSLDGLLSWIDAIQTSAEAAGYPVVWLGDED